MSFSGQQPTPLEHGYVTAIDVTDPAAGAEASQLLANNFRYLITGISYVIVTDATVINRYPGIKFNTLAGQPRIVTAGLQITATNAVQVNFLPGYPSSGVWFGTTYTTNLPYPILMDGNDTISTNHTNLQAGDAITSMKIFVRTWPMQTI